MKHNIPKSPFTTHLSGSARETELRLRSIFQWKKKRPPAVLLVLAALAVLLCGSLVSCQVQQEEPLIDGGVTEGDALQAEDSSAVLTYLQDETAGDQDDLNSEDEDREGTQMSEPVGFTEAYKEVLQGNLSFFSVDAGKNLNIDQVNQAVTPDSSVAAKAKKFAVVDLDGDGTPEVILSLVINGDISYGYLVLHYQDGVVYGYIFSERELSDIRTDGTFWNSGGASNVGICKATFDRDEYSFDQFTYSWVRPSEYNDAAYIVDHQEATEEEWNLALSQWKEIPYVEWYELTDDNIETMLR